MVSKEQRRLNKLVYYENEALAQGFSCIAGVDEAGRGPLAGPVVAGACIIPKELFFKGINDSKQLTPEQRQELFEQLTTCQDVVYGIGIVTAQDIDRLNIYRASIRAMLEAVFKLSVTPDYLLVDGLMLPHPTIPSQKIIEGDALSQSIAAASIIAKVTRDRIMEEFDAQWPQYGFKQHKGYATEQHLSAITIHGPCPIHRLSFDPFRTEIAEKNDTQLTLF